MLVQSDKAKDMNENTNRDKIEKTPTPPYFGRPLPTPTMEMIMIKDALYPKWTMEQFMTIQMKFGVIHNRASDIDRFGAAMHWKIDSRNVNQGMAYYNQTQDTFFLRSATEKTFIHSNGDFAKDALWMEIERKSTFCNFHVLNRL